LTTGVRTVDHRRQDVDEQLSAQHHRPRDGHRDDGGAERPQEHPADDEATGANARDDPRRERGAGKRADASHANDEADIPRGQVQGGLCYHS